MNTFLRFYRTTVGMKQLMAITGIGLVLFVVGHLTGNLLIFGGSNAMNTYAAWLQSQGPFLWVARLGLLAVFGLHIGLGIRLKLRNQQARTVAYHYDETIRASWASRSMLLSGSVILAFVLFHLLHFTVGAIQPDHAALLDEQGRHDVYRMVVRGFSNPLVSLVYLSGLALLAVHLSHGLSSLFQTLGLSSSTYAALVRRISIAIAILLFLGYAQIPLAILFGFVKEDMS